METTTATNVTDAQILQLRREARQAGDDAMVHICGVAVGDEAPVVTGEQWGERYGGGGLEFHQDSILACDSRGTARRLCAEAIADAEASL